MPAKDKSLIGRIVLTPKQSRAWWKELENPAVRRVFYDGGARATKTMLVCCWLVSQADRFPGSTIIILRRHRISAEKSVWAQTLKPLLIGRPGSRVMDGPLEIQFGNGSLIRVDGTDDQDRVDRILGTEYSHIFFNECTQMSWRTITTILSRLAEKSVPVRKALFDCNPKGQRHWTYKMGVLHQDPDTGIALPDHAAWRRRSWTPYDNPYLPADALLTLESMTGTQRRRMLLGEWCEQEGSVYDEFDEDIHVIDEMPAGWESWQTVSGIDFGYVNPFVCLSGALDGDGRLYFFFEHYLSRRTVDVHAEILKRTRPVPLWTVADHDAEDAATLRACGIDSFPAFKDVEAGIKAVKCRLKVQPDGRPRVYFLRSAMKETIGEMYDYAWEQPRDGRNAKEAPVKDRDHAMDTVRYILAQLDLVGKIGDYGAFSGGQQDDGRGMWTGLT